MHLGSATRISRKSKLIGLEIAGTIEGFHAQAEYFIANFDDSDSGSDDGYYAQAGYVFNGNRPYKGGIFKRVKPTNGATAIEIVARYENGVGKYSDVGIGSGEGEQLSLAVNFYPISNVRFGLNYMTGKLDSGAKGDEYRLRTQFTF